MLTYEDIFHYYYIIAFVFSFIFLSVVLLLIYHGAFYKVEVKSMRPPYGSDLYVAYKFTQNYSKSRMLLTEAQTIAPHLDSFSIYHENFVVSKLNMSLLDLCSIFLYLIVKIQLYYIGCIVCVWIILFLMNVISINVSILIQLFVLSTVLCLISHEFHEFTLLTRI